MKPSLLESKIEKFGKFRCVDGSPKLKCAEKHICRFDLDKKYSKTSMTIDLRSIRSRKLDPLWCPKQI